MTDPIPSAVPQTPTQPTAPASGPSKSPVLGIVALSAAVLAFVLAFIGPIAWLGILLAIAALILGILAINKSSKGLGITAVVIAPVALLIAIIVTIVTALAFAVLATAGDSLSGGQISASTPAEAGATQGDAKPAEAASDAGTRENPYPIGSTLSNDEWTVVINSFTPDGNAIVAEGNMFNSEPEAGTHYAIVNYTVTYNGEDSSYASFVPVAFVATDGKVFTGSESFASLEDGFGLDELYAGASATGSKVFQLPDGAEGVLRVQLGMFADDVFVATS